MTARTLNAHHFEMGRVAFERQADRNKPLQLIESPRPSPAFLAFIDYILKEITKGWAHV